MIQGDFHVYKGYDIKRRQLCYLCMTVVGKKTIHLPHTCRNCGYIGHLYKDCPHPLMSFGIICFRTVTDPVSGKYTVQYLMIQRKDSLSFMEFIRGKYKLEQIEYIKQLLSCMTQIERAALLTQSFDFLWNYVWYQPTMTKPSTEFLEAKRKFDSLREGVFIGQDLVTMEALLQDAPSPYDEPEWGFPKGRRKLHEDDKDCAIREFCEETGFQKEDIQVLPQLAPFEEIFFGTNNVLYRHSYYIARMTRTDRDHIIVDPANLNQAREVGAVQWFNFEEALLHIRAHNRERKQLFHQVNQKVLASI
jgi:8-oxo-dGTP pyrophosphatase MutT (NUDIX family)